MKPETIERRRREHAAARRAASQELSTRILLAYHTEDDRQYAEDMWGTMLNERGIYYEDREQENGN